MNDLFKTLSSVVPADKWLTQLHDTGLINDIQFEYLKNFMATVDKESNKLFEIVVCRMVFYKGDNVVFTAFMKELFDNLPNRISDKNALYISFAQWMFYWDKAAYGLETMLRGEYNVAEMLDNVALKIPSILSLSKKMAASSINEYEHLVKDKKAWHRAEVIFGKLNDELRYDYSYMLMILELENKLGKLDKMNNLISIARAQLPEMLAFRFISREMQLASESGELGYLLSDNRDDRNIVSDIINKYASRR